MISASTLSGSEPTIVRDGTQIKNEKMREAARTATERN
jgi:hypothetical protein